MKNFNELFEEAAQIADSRNKVFNQLIDRTVTEILPNFCDACRKLGITNVFLITKNQANTYSELSTWEYEDFYGISVDTTNKTFCDIKCTYDNYGHLKYLPDGEPLPFDPTKQVLTSYCTEPQRFLKSGIVEFVRLLNSRLADYNRKYAEKTIEAESLLLS